MRFSQKKRVSALLDRINSKRILSLKKAVVVTMQQRVVVGFYYDKGKIKPITQSLHKLNRKRIIKEGVHFIPVTPQGPEKLEHFLRARDLDKLEQYLRAQDRFVTSIAGKTPIYRVIVKIGRFITMPIPVIANSVKDAESKAHQQLEKISKDNNLNVPITILHGTKRWKA